MSIPVTTRLDSATVEAIDLAVTAGLGPHRGAIISAAVQDWLARHGEEAIAASYRHRYAEPDPAQEELTAGIAAFSVAACLAANGD